MAAVSHRRRFVYFPIPKNATSSLKRVVFQLDTGRKYTNKYKSKIGCGVHHLYPSIVDDVWLRCYPSYVSLAIVRDPIKRILSAYSNRVIHAKSLERSPDTIAQLRDLKLSTTPSLDEFIENLDQYLSASKYVRKHTIPQHRYIGEFWKQIRFRLPLERISEVPEILREELGVKIKLPHAQTGGAKMSVSQLSLKHLDKLIKRYRDDYKMLEELYSPDQIR